MSTSARSTSSSVIERYLIAMCARTRHWSSRPEGGGSGAVTPARLVKVATAGEVAVGTRRAPTLSEAAVGAGRLDGDHVELGERADVLRGAEGEVDVDAVPDRRGPEVHLVEDG